MTANESRTILGPAGRTPTATPHTSGPAVREVHRDVIGCAVRRRLAPPGLDTRPVRPSARPSSCSPRPLYRGGRNMPTALPLRERRDARHHAALTEWASLRVLNDVALVLGCRSPATAVTATAAGEAGSTRPRRPLRLDRTSAYLRHVSEGQAAAIVVSLRDDTARGYPMPVWRRFDRTADRALAATVAPAMLSFGKPSSPTSTGRTWTKTWRTRSPNPRPPMPRSTARPSGWTGCSGTRCAGPPILPVTPPRPPAAAASSRSGPLASTTVQLGHNVGYMVRREFTPYQGQQLHRHRGRLDRSGLARRNLPSDARPRPGALADRRPPRPRHRGRDLSRLRKAAR